MYNVHCKYMEENIVYQHQCNARHSGSLPYHAISHLRTNLPFSDAIALEAPQGAPYVIVDIPPNTSVTPVTQNHYYSISTVQYLTMPQKMMRYPADLQYLSCVPPRRHY